MKVLQVVQQPSGGAATHVRWLVSGLVARGVDVEVATPAPGGVVPAMDAPVRPVDIAPNIGAVADHLRAGKVLRRLIADNGYDLVHLHSQQSGAVGRLATLGTRTPVVYTPHCFAYAHQEAAARKGAALRRAIRLNAERAMSPLASTIVCVSDYERQAAIADRVTSGRRLQTIRNGVPASLPVTPDPDLIAFKGDDPLIGYVSRLSPEKGIRLLFDALERLRDRGSRPKVAIVGEGPDWDYVVDRISTSGLQDQISLKPFTGAVGPALAALDAFVLPSVWESFPISILEAMAVGLPVIATDVGGISEAVADGETGVLVALKDPDALAEAIERLAGDRALRERMGAAGLARCTASFGVGAMVDNTIAAYERVLISR